MQKAKILAGPGTAHLAADTILTITLARSLLTLGMRPPIVASSLQVSPYQARRWWREIHGTAPKTGLLPWKAAARITTHTEAAHARLFYTLYLRCAQTQIKTNHRNSVRIALDALERAYRLYRIMSGSSAPLDINTCWLVARDASAGILSERYCPTCARSFFYALSHAALRRCPWCGMMRRTADNGQKRAVIEAAPQAAVG
ncbi:MAG: FlhC family transcriptional regulator [Acidiferrobacterales bacterium]